MQPLTVILGIVLGSVFSIAFCLALVWVIFGLRQGEDSRYATDLPLLAEATVLFSLVTILSALSFVGSIRESPWRWWPMLGLALGLTGIGFYYWPA